MLNEYFEFISAAVTAHGGEILRFIGDAMLIVFPIDDTMCGKTAANAAVDAATDARSTLATLNHQRRRHGKPEIEFGVGLNIGEVIYGNVGAPERLDFTLFGSAVNKASRVETLSKSLERLILLTERVARRLDRELDDLGEHPLRGVSKPITNFTPRQ